VTVASLAQGETKLSQIALNLSGDLERHGLTWTMRGSAGGRPQPEWQPAR
jgi:translocation and assembly module TamB